MHKQKCNLCNGTGEKTVFSDDEWEKFLEWKRATDKQFVIDEAVHGKGFVMVSITEMEDSYDKWRDFK